MERLGLVARLDALDAEADEVFEVELVVLPLAALDAELAADELRCAALRVEVGERGDGARDAAPLEAVAPERYVECIDFDEEWGSLRGELLRKVGIEREHQSALGAEEFVDSAGGNKHVDCLFLE